MEFKIISKKLGRTITFSMPGSRYIYADLDGKPGTLGQQICKGGAVMSGPALCYTGSTYDDFVKVCRRWYRAYIRRTLTFDI